MEFLFMTGHDFLDVHLQSLIWSIDWLIWKDSQLGWTREPLNTDHMSVAMLQDLPNGG